MALCIALSHRTNIQRMYSGTENRLARLGLIGGGKDKVNE
jgi:hypothetical protein